MGARPVTPAACFPLQLVGRSFQIGCQVEHLRRGVVATKHSGVLAEARGSGPQLGQDLVTTDAGFHPTATPESQFLMQHLLLTADQTAVRVPPPRVDTALPAIY
jgi:hypothetical protein